MMMKSPLRLPMPRTKSRRQRMPTRGASWMEVASMSVTLSHLVGEDADDGRFAVDVESR